MRTNRKVNGDEWRSLSWKEYKENRLLKGNFSEKEKTYFDKVIKFCESSQAAAEFSDDWGKI